jgi:hypothetical protein
MEERGMPSKKHKVEEIVAELRQVDVLTARGRPVAEAVRSIGGDGSHLSSLAVRIWWLINSGCKVDH